MKLLNVLDAGHKVNSKEYPLNNENWINKHWNQWKFQLSNPFGNIIDNEYLNPLQCKIKDLNKSELIKLKNNSLFFIQ